MLPRTQGLEESFCFRFHGRRRGHTFDQQIETDGVSCSILLKRRDVVGKRAKEPKAP
jgi:hypothetical protein